MLLGVKVGLLFRSQFFRKLVSPSLCNFVFFRQFERCAIDVGQLQQIIKNITVETATALVPEIKLHLITPQCPLWRSKPEDFPIEDPYWAFFWPGGQALCRYVLDNHEICKQKNVLDIGSGCGALAIAAATNKANLVIANDIDPIASIAMRMNIDLNKELRPLVANIQLYSSDILPVDVDRPLENFFHKQRLLCNNNQHPHTFDVVLVGDMCYDEAMAFRLQLLLKAITISNPDVVILLGDPGRHAMDVVFDQIELVHEYPLAQSTEFSWEFPSSCVYRFRP